MPTSPPMQAVCGDDLDVLTNLGTFLTVLCYTAFVDHRLEFLGIVAHRTAKPDTGDGPCLRQCPERAR